MNGINERSCIKHCECSGIEQCYQCYHLGVRNDSKIPYKLGVMTVLCGYMNKSECVTDKQFSCLNSNTNGVLMRSSRTNKEMSPEDSSWPSLKLFLRYDTLLILTGAFEINQSFRDDHSVFFISIYLFITTTLKACVSRLSIFKNWSILSLNDRL